ncbi:4'-phosphopantetheinyl transferase [Streptomyces sp. NPDC017405]|uniref:4'-phosphopantetheinyl transferase family protein n=1 Tax=unclassified Streptomyces TaxID=2593676 RepID=UPI00379F8EB2
MIEAILPTCTAAAEAFGDPPQARLLPEEAGLVARAVPSRRREFTTARHCARQALSALGLPPVPVLRGPFGAPLWPAGVVGSITHCAGYRCGVVARGGDVASLGVDAEPDVPLPSGAEDVIALPWEAGHLRHLDAVRPRVNWGRLLFSAKESVYKAWFPLGGRMLSFEHATVTFETPSVGGTDCDADAPDARATGFFSARMHAAAAEGRAPAPGLLYGRWLAARGLLLTSVVIPAAAPAPLRPPAPHLR